MYDKKFRYRKFSSYLKKRYGCRVYKVGVNAGFTCPNRDGTKGEQGCIYCNNEAFGRKERPVREQIEDGIEFTRKRYNAEKHIVYFQSYTNTYATVEELRKIYSVIKEYDSVVGLSIGTRPDCIDRDKLKLIESFTDDYDVWIEFGLQSVNDKTLNFINRGHSFKEFVEAIELTRQFNNIKISPHIIIGLPGETMEDFKATAVEMGKLEVEGIKLHPMHIVKDTVLADMYKKGNYRPLKFEQYVSAAANFLEYMSPKTVIHRMTATCPENILIAPDWINDKGKVIAAINKKLKERESYQGKFFKDIKMEVKSAREKI